MAKGDIVVTQDYGVAALGKGCRAINQDGLLFTGENIQGLLFSCYVGQKVRRGGGRTRGPKKREKAQDALFEQAFRKLLEASR